jgi:hypothetical protein
MNDYLLRYAIDNVWCNPTMDKQFVYQLRQLTPKYGVRGAWGVDYETYTLPSAQDWWHVYQIGSVIPSLMGLPKLYNQWMSLDLLANQLKVLAEVYVSSGIQFPRHQTYILITSSQNLIVAVRVNPKFPDLDTHKPYLHVYSNSFYNSKRSDQGPLYEVVVKSKTFAVAEEVRQFQVELMDFMAAKGGYGQYFVNGRFVNEISPVTATIGDTADFVWDSSIKGMLEFPIANLPTFLSTLDSQRKYLLHPTVRATTIEFYDDVDAYLYKPGAVPGRFSGVSYHHNEGNWLRMLTHQDYSLPVDRVVRIAAEHPEDPRHGTDPVRWPSDLWPSVEPLTVRLYLRHSGYERPLIADSSRIQELYRLPDADIVRAMVGADSTAIWHAAKLENAPYVQFMSASPDDIFPIAFQRPDTSVPEKTEAQNFAGDVFGYHEAAHILSQNPCPIITDQNVRYAELAYNYWENATIFEYTADGTLINYYYHVAGTRHQIINPSCGLVEAISGKGGETLGESYGLDPVLIGTGFNFRVYVAPVWAGVPSDEWIDITDLPNRHEWGFLDDTTDVHRWVWTASAVSWFGMVRRDEQFLINSYNFNKTDGVIRFTLGSMETYNTQYNYKLLEIPFGQLDVFCNGKSLVYGLDFVIEDMQVVVSNLKWLTDDVNKIMYRGHGFCTPDFQMYEPTELGFVEYGVISNNGTYNVHRHKMQRLVIDGRYRDPATVPFEEDRQTTTLDELIDSTPYQIQTPQSRFRDVYDTDNQARLKDDAIDKEVSDFMTEYFPQRTRPNPDVFREHYLVFSVFSNKILADLVAGRLNPPEIIGFYSDEQIRVWLKRYEWLVPYDIVNRGYNHNHVKVYPHWHVNPVGLNRYQIAFFKRILGLYLREPMDLAPFIYQTG